MTDPKQAALKAKITRLRNANKKPGLTLAERLDAQPRIRAAEEELRLYRLNINAEKAYQKALPKLTRQITKAMDNVAREIAREQLRAASSKPPAEFQSWGHTRTMAWLATAKLGMRLVKQRRPNLEKLLAALRSIGTIGSASLEACQTIISPPKK